MREIALAMMLGAVACWKPYQAEAKSMGNGQYMIRAKAESSERDAYQRAYERASQVCSAGYDVVDNGADATRTYKRVAEVVTHEVKLVVRCTTSAAGPSGG